MAMNKQQLKEYVLENVSLSELVQEMNSWNGAFDELAYYENDGEFFYMFFEGNAMEAVRAAQYGDYNYMDDLVTFDGYGNLKSTSYYGAEMELKDNIDDIIEELISNHCHYYLDDELEEILNEMEENGEI